MRVVSTMLSVSAILLGLSLYAAAQGPPAPGDNMPPDEQRQMGDQGARPDFGPQDRPRMKRGDRRHGPKAGPPMGRKEGPDRSAKSASRWNDRKVFGPERNWVQRIDRGDRRRGPDAERPMMRHKGPGHRRPPFHFRQHGDTGSFGCGYGPGPDFGRGFCPNFGPDFGPGVGPRHGQCFRCPRMERGDLQYGPETGAPMGRKKVPGHGFPPFHFHQRGGDEGFGAGYGSGPGLGFDFAPGFHPGFDRGFGPGRGQCPDSGCPRMYRGNRQYGPESGPPMSDRGDDGMMAKPPRGRDIGPQRGTDRGPGPRGGLDRGPDQDQERGPGLPPGPPPRDGSDM